MNLVLYLAIITLSVTQSACVKIFNKDCDNPIRFNALKTFSACVLMALLFAWKFTLHVPSLLFGAVYGLSLTASLYSGYKALAIGPLSLTSMTVSFSVIMPIIYGISFCGERVTVFRLIGFLLLVFTIIFNKLAKGSIDGSLNKKWWLFVWITFFANGVCSILQKAHQIRFPGEYTAEFMLSATIVSFVCFLIFYVLKNSVKIEKISNSARLSGIVAGVANVLVNYFSIRLAGYRDASVLFPLISVGTILGALVLGMVKFKEKPKPATFAVIIFGIAAVVFLKL